MITKKQGNNRIMHIPDGSNIDYTNNKYPRPNIYAWGWLGNFTPKSKNKMPQDLIELIKYAQPVNYCMGEHTCEICNNHQFNGSIKILHNNKLYICPSNVHHYIELHDYCPPPEVIEALKNGKILNEKETIEYDKNDPILQKGIEESNKAYEEQNRKEAEEMKIAREIATKKVKSMSKNQLIKAISSVFLKDN